MDLPPFNTRRHHEQETQSPASPYPIAYFLCDPKINAKTLKVALGLAKAPKLRKARVVGYTRACENEESTVAYDGYDFGEWAPEEFVKGVVFEAACVEEEERLKVYVGNAAEVKTVQLEVACPSLLGLVGKMKVIEGRVFVSAGEGDTLVGSEVSRATTATMRPSEELSEGGFEREMPRSPTPAHSEVDSEVTDVAHELEILESSDPNTAHELENVTPRITPSATRLPEAAIPSLSLEPIPTIIVAKEPETSHDKPETETGAVTDMYAGMKHMAVEEEEKHTKEDEQVKAHEQSKAGEATIKDKALEEATKSSVGVGTTRVDESPKPTTPASSIEHRALPLRPKLITKTPRKTSESIKSLVMKYEGLSPKTTPVKKA